MQHTMFGYPMALSDEWEDRSVHTYYLRTDDGAAPASQAGGAAGGAPLGLALSSGPRAASGYRPNVVVVREPAGDRDPKALLDEQRRGLQERVPQASEARTGQTTIGKHDAEEREVRIPLDHPMPALVQWHLALKRDGYLFHVCCTTTQQRFEEDKERFRRFVEAWG